MILATDFEAAGRLSRQLLDCGYNCAVARRSEGLKAVSESEPRFVVLDHDPSDLDGWSLLVRITEVSNAPVVVVAADPIGSLTADVLGLGAAAFVRKPVSGEELCLRVAAVLRGSTLKLRQGATITDPFFQIDLVEKRASVLELELDLAPTEFRLLVALARNPEVALSHDRILELVWPQGCRERDQVKLYVSYLRRSVTQVAKVDPVVTVHGVGYRYEPRRLD